MCCLPMDGIVTVALQISLVLIGDSTRNRVAGVRPLARATGNNGLIDGPLLNVHQFISFPGNCSIFVFVLVGEILSMKMGEQLVR
jgi:hypothetical protein